MELNNLKNKKELNSTLGELRAKLARLNFEKGSNTLKDSSQIGKTKKDIARTLTILRQSRSQISKS